MPLDTAPHRGTAFFASNSRFGLAPRYPMIMQLRDFQRYIGVWTRAQFVSTLYRHMTVYLIADALELELRGYLFVAGEGFPGLPNQAESVMLVEGLVKATSPRSLT